jgi:hypothetical protein
MTTLLQILDFFVACGAEPTVTVDKLAKFRKDKNEEEKAMSDDEEKDMYNYGYKKGYDEFREEATKKNQVI